MHDATASAVAHRPWFTTTGSEYGRSMTNTHQIVGLLGTGVVTPGTGLATADDLGLTRGDGCFEVTLVVWEGKSRLVHDLDEHLDRMASSASRLDIPMPAKEDWIELIGDVLQEWEGGDEAILKLVLTRGDEHGDGTPLGFATLTAMPASMRDQRTGGIRVITRSRGMASDAFADAPWLLGGVKTLSYAVNRAAAREAAAQGADDVVFVSTDGYALEGPTSALMWLRGNVLGTTPVGDTGILDSISKRKLLTGQHGFETREELITADELRACDGVWLISSARGIAAVTAIDGEPIAVDQQTTEVLRRLNGF